MRFDRRKAGDICIWYGFLVFIISATATMVFARDAFNSYLQGDYTLYITMSAIPAVGVLIYRTGRYGALNTFRPLEFVVASLSALGLSLLISLTGFLLVITGKNYSGVEKWVPETESIEALLQRAVTELELSSEVREESMQLLGELRDKGLVGGRPAEEVAGAIVYIVSRMNEDPRTLDEVASVTGAEKKGIGKAYRYIARETEIRILPPRPVNFVDRFADSLELPENVKERAVELIERAEDEGFISGKSPRGIAASAIYLATYQEGEYRSMNETSDVLGVTTITIRERSKEFIRELGLVDYPEHLKKGLQDI